MARPQRPSEGDRSRAALLLIDGHAQAERQPGDRHARLPRQEQPEQSAHEAALVVDGAEPPDVVAGDPCHAVPLPHGLHRVHMRDEGDLGLGGTTHHQVVATPGHGVPRRRQAETRDAAFQVVHDGRLGAGGRRYLDQPDQLVQGPRTRPSELGGVRRRQRASRRGRLGSGPDRRSGRDRRHGRLSLAAAARCDTP